MCYNNVILQALSFSPTFVDWTQGLGQNKFARWIRDEDSVLGINLLFDILHILEWAHERSGIKVFPANGLHQIRSQKDSAKDEPRDRNWWFRTAGCS